MERSGSRFYEFGAFKLDAQRRLLERDGELVHISPRAFDLLHVLVSNPGETLSHDQLLDEVWEGTFVEQGNLKKAVSTLRQILGIEGGEFITTVPRRGYRFTAPVRTYAEQAFEIRETQTEITVEEKFETRISGRSAAAIAAVLACVSVATLAFSGWYFLRTPDQRFSVESVEHSRMLSSGTIGGGILSPDGKLYVYREYKGGKTSLRAVQTGTGISIELLPPFDGAIWSTSISPDGNFVYFYLKDDRVSANNGVYKIASLGGEKVRISSEPLFDLKPSPDGKNLAATRVVHGAERQTHQILTIASDGTDEKVVTQFPVYTLARGIAWSPDGKSIVAGRMREVEGSRSVYGVFEISIADGSPQTIMAEQENPFQLLSWMPDKQSLLIRRRNPDLENFQLWQYFPSRSEFIRITNDEHEYGEATLSADGSTIGVTRQLSLGSLWVSDEQMNFSQVATDSGYGVAWANNDTVAYSSSIDGRENIRTLSLRTGRAKLLTSGGDGTRLFPVAGGGDGLIAFASSRDGSREIYRASVYDEPLTRLTDSRSVGQFSIMPDGQSIIYSKFFPENGDWRLMRQTGQTTVEVPNSLVTEWAISSDGNRVAMLAPEVQLGPERVTIRDLSSGAELQRFEIANLDCLQWVPNSEAIAFIRQRNDVYEVVVQPLDGAPERIILSLPGERIRRFAFSPDGKRIAVTRDRVQNDAVLIRRSPIKQ
ncbi:MAG TPA: winged helix-turn-helix domain-containing protein [Pyrinomonadaceae bacterium]|nr:winged helix-turn-helix domain-containing protein [Pyrinomonadaceae bacterium]